MAWRIGKHIAACCLVVDSSRCGNVHVPRPPVCRKLKLSLMCPHFVLLPNCQTTLIKLDLRDRKSVV